MRIETNTNNKPLKSQLSSVQETKAGRRKYRSKSLGGREPVAGAANNNRAAGIVYTGHALEEYCEEMNSIVTFNAQLVTEHIKRMNKIMELEQYCAQQSRTIGLLKVNIEQLQNDILHCDERLVCLLKEKHELKKYVPVRPDSDGDFLQCRNESDIYDDVAALAASERCDGMCSIDYIIDFAKIEFSFENSSSSLHILGKKTEQNQSCSAA